MVFVCKCAKRQIRKKTKKLSQFLKSHILGMLEATLLKLGIWSTDVGTANIVLFSKDSMEN